MAVTIAETSGHVTETELKSPLSPPVTMRRNDRSHSPKYAISNGDDHLRNHGFLLESEGWRLSPAFDIAPYATRNGNAVEVKSLSLGILPNGDAAATVENLLFVSKFFDVSYEEAVNYLERASATIRKEWNALAKQVSQVPIGQPNFQLPSFGQWPTQSNVHKYRSY